MTPYVIAGLLVVAAVAVWYLLRRITAEGGASGKDAAATAAQVLGEANVLRGSRSDDDPAWDGHNRLASPTQDGGIG